MSTYRLLIITPERVFYDGEINRIVLKGAEGNMAILANHTPLMTTLALSELKIYSDPKKFRSATLLGGFAKIEPEKVVILADAAEWPEEIDVERALKAKEMAEATLKKSDQDLVWAQAALRRAIVRIEVSKTKDNR
ncbi:ATP synthase F1 subunit epsilon [Alkalibacter saccharofermentans]|uniref:ATP synthase epsilon chain n=1 Tax=Alkalibacter saccharofermentans DSM 14828 TaxID=1120975 RepID=A0A1M5A855_9FIRM|nr:ATP synthase F1 subunit epsilon [Alkalibacter saccharofermentans]SHF26468.1 F-type H+-transporting ATPase subunit epsilon [Alkalibacter saccharofermentans DSM 14828]